MRLYTLAAMADLVSQWVLIRDPMEASTHLSLPHTTSAGGKFRYTYIHAHRHSWKLRFSTRERDRNSSPWSQSSLHVYVSMSVGAFGSPNPSRISHSSCQWPMTRRSCHLISWIPPLPHLSGGILRHTRCWEGGEGDLNRLLMTDGLQGYFLIMTHLSGRLVEICVRTLGAIGQNKAIWSVWLSLGIMCIRWSISDCFFTDLTILRTRIEEEPDPLTFSCSKQKNGKWL